MLVEFLKYVLGTGILLLILTIMYSVYMTYFGLVIEGELERDIFLGIYGFGVVCAAIRVVAEMYKPCIKLQ